MRKITGKMIAAVLAVTLTVSGLCYTAANPQEVGAAQTYQLVWADEFNGTSLDTSVWNYETGNGNWGWGNGEVEYYTDRTQNVEVKDGYLQIHALKENYNNYNYTSGRITTKGKKAVLYGKIEAKLKVENGNQDGVWPAFWMMGNNIAQGVGWPRCGEIDIMEHANSNGYIGGCLHWNADGLNGEYNPTYYSSGDDGRNYYYKDNTNNGINGWHTYGLIWDEDHMEWQVDGVTFFEQAITEVNAYCFQKEQFFLFNLAIGGTGTAFTGYKTANANTYQTATMYVDYLRVYQLREGGDAAESTTVKPAERETETVISYETVDSVADSKNIFDSYFGGEHNWGTATGSISDSTNTGVTVHMNSIGEDLWQIQTSLNNLDYIAGNTYTYKCTITSDVTKNVRVKVVGNNDDYIFSQDDITVKAGEPYYYEKQVTIPENYNGRLDLYFGLGKNGETLDSATAVNITISDVSFVTEKQVITVIDKGPVTTKTPDVTSAESETVKKPARASIKKVIKKKKSLKIKLKKVQNAKGYQIVYSRSKKFKKVHKKTTTRRKYTIKKLKSKKKYYIKVRAYVLDKNGQKVYGRFSKVKKAKTK